MYTFSYRGREIRTLGYYKASSEKLNLVRCGYRFWGSRFGSFEFGVFALLVAWSTVRRLGVYRVLGDVCVCFLQVWFVEL